MINKLYYLTIDDNFDRENYNLLLSFVSKDKQRQVIQLSNDISKKVTLYAEALSRIIACNDLGVSNTEITILRNQYGKPYIKEFPKCHFNISHTSNIIVIVVSNNEIGVDIEKIRNADLRIAKRFFTKYEQEYILENSLVQNNRFYEVWTKKEAYMKYVGKGLHMPINSFNVFDRNISEKLKTFKRDDYLITICSDCLDNGFSTIETNEKQVESMMLSMLSNNKSIKV